MTRKFTKIVATVGPASSSPEVLEGMIREGVNVIRLNFSHGDHATHATTVERVREVDAKLGTHTALLADMQGPKLRVGMMAEGSELVEGAPFTIHVGKGEGDATQAWTAYPHFAGDVKPGEPVLLDDGKLRLVVEETDGKETVRCKVVHGGILSSRKGLNLPSTDISLPSFDPRQEGLDPAEVNRLFHVKKRSGEILTGVDGFIEIWDEIPSLNFLAKVGRLRLVRPFLDLGYKGFVVARPYLPRRKCETGACQI